MTAHKLLHEINDQYGHKTGDNIMIGFAGTFKQSYKKCSMAARIGGDEFAAIVYVDNTPAATPPVQYWA